MAEQVVDGGFFRGLELQIGVLYVSHQQALALQGSADPLADRLDERFQRLRARHRETSKHRWLAGMLAAGVYSAPLPVAAKVGCAFLFSLVGGVLPTACLAGAPVHAPSPTQVGAVNGIIVQGANLGTLLGAPALAAAVAVAGGWSQAGWLLLFAGAGGIVLAFGLGRVESRRVGTFQLCAKVRSLLGR